MSRRNSEPVPISDLFDDDRYVWPDDVIDTAATAETDAERRARFALTPEECAIGLAHVAELREQIERQRAARGSATEVDEPEEATAVHPADEDF